MKTLISQILLLWKKGPLLQKMFVLSIFIACISLFVLFSFKKETYQKPKEVIAAVKAEEKGYALFDANTWIKGEKELQVLEMRALKGQLEKDLCAFESIKEAKVILDLPPQKTMTSYPYPTKASVIVALFPNSKMTCSLLSAIKNHLLGAVRGLDAKNIAISDTKGVLYQAIDSDVSLSNPRALVEEEIQTKIHSMLDKLTEPNNVHVAINYNIDNKVLFVSFLFNSTSFVKIPEEIEMHVTNIAHGYGLEPKFSFVSYPFYKTPSPIERKEKKTPSFFILGSFCFILLLSISLMLFFARFFQKKEKKAENLFDMMKNVNLSTLSSLIQEEPPSTIALMLSYLEKERREALLEKLPEKVKKEVINCLSELKTHFTQK